MEHHKHPERFVRHVVSVPFIWMMIVPLALFDVCLEVYHRVCFALYGLPYVRRWDYLTADRHRLKYLSVWDKINCLYCGYANGLIMYAQRIAGETEKYWCGIKHQPGTGLIVPPHHRDFIDYGDEKAYRATQQSCKLEKR